MGKIFDMNNPVWQFIGKLVDAFVLHILWLVCSLPIVTIGASTTALYYAMMKDVADEDPHYIKSFFRSFKQNLKQGIVMGLIFLIVSTLLALALRFYFMQTGTFYVIARGVSIFMAVVIIFVLQYAYALLARFENTTMKLIQNAFFMSIRHLGWSIVMTFIFAAVYFVIFFLNFLPLLFLGYGLVVYLDSYILNRILKPYIKTALGDDGEEEKDPDAWVIPDEELPEDPDVPALEASEAFPEETPEISEGMEEAADSVQDTADDITENAEEEVREIPEASSEEEINE